MQNNWVQNRSLFAHNKIFGFSYAPPVAQQPNIWRGQIIGGTKCLILGESRYLFGIPILKAHEDFCSKNLGAMACVHHIY